MRYKFNIYPYSRLNRSFSLPRIYISSCNGVVSYFRLSLGLFLSLLLSTQGALGYSIHSGLTDGCHERITREAFKLALPNLNPGDQIPVPKSEAWRKIADRLLVQSQLSLGSPQRSFDSDAEDRAKLSLVSLLIGVRSPDTEGHAVTNFSSLRQIHADPSAEGQYAHALRGPNDDGQMGDELAVLGLRNEIRQLLGLAFESIRDKSPEEQVITVQLYFDFYGLVDIEVWEPAYLIGRMLHAIQDSFAHTVRSDDLKRILHVLNYVDAISGDLKESVDGLPHSEFMDSCDGDTELISDTATLVSAQLIESINLALMMRDVSLIEDTLDEWVTYEPGCTISNDYCNSIWVELARKEPTGPYLGELVGCQVNRGHGAGIADLSAYLIFTLLSILWFGRRILKGLQNQTRFSSISKIFSFLLMLFIVSYTYTKSADAQPSIQLEAHASLLSDTPDRSALASTYGWGIRGGYIWASWMALIHLEQNTWLSTELSNVNTPGVLNAGIGAAHIYGEGFVRTSLVFGSSTLLFDTLFDQSGATGLFVDLRPIELSWQPWHRLRFNLTPFSFTYVSPVLEKPPIKMVLYRTSIGIELRL